MSENDRGQTDALAKGFRMSNGDIFAWLNSDDTYLPGTLQIVSDFFHDHPDTGLMYGDANYVDSAGSIIGKYRTEKFDLDTLAAANIICQPSAFFRREVFESVGGLDGTLDFVMDYDLWIRIGRRFPCNYLPGLLATYRLHETSKTISSATLINSSEESLAVTMRHFSWAPITRVYTSCIIWCKAHLPNLLGRKRLIVVAAAGAGSILRSLYLNRGFSRRDIKLLKLENFSKLFKTRLEIMTGK
jgi:GT2 family glycosyltransferase